MNHLDKEQEIIHDLVKSIQETILKVENLHQFNEEAIKSTNELGIEVVQEDLKKLTDFKCAIESLEIATEYLDRMKI